MVGNIRQFLRRQAIRHGLYTPCCASCGEIGRRPEAAGAKLCASLPISFPIDAVIVPGCRHEARKAETLAQDLSRSLAGLKQHCSWLRTIFGAGFAADPCLPDLSCTDTPGDLPPELHIHAIPGLAECYLVVRAGWVPDRDLLPADFFTPNGLPFLLLEKTGSAPMCRDTSSTIFGGFRVAGGVFPQNKDNAAAFGAGMRTDSGDYFALAGEWAAAASRTVPLGVQA